MLVRPLDEEPFDSQVRQDGQSALRVAKGICRDGNTWKVAKLLLQKMQSKLKVFNNVIVVSTAFIMLYEPSP